MQCLLPSVSSTHGAAEGTIELSTPTPATDAEGVSCLEGAQRQLTREQDWLLSTHPPVRGPWPRPLSPSLGLSLFLNNGRSVTGYNSDRPLSPPPKHQRSAEPKPLLQATMGVSLRIRVSLEKAPPLHSGSLAQVWDPEILLHLGPLSFIKASIC